MFGILSNDFLNERDRLLRGPFNFAVDQDIGQPFFHFISFFSQERDFMVNAELLLDHKCSSLDLFCVLEQTVPN